MWRKTSIGLLYDAAIPAKMAAGSENVTGDTQTSTNQSTSEISKDNTLTLEGTYLYDLA